jgi:hypothetical protein
MPDKKLQWKAPRLVVQGHVSEIVATSGLGKTVYGPDNDSLKATMGGNPMNGKD